MLILQIIFIFLAVCVGKKIGVPIQQMSERLKVLATGDFREIKDSSFLQLLDRSDEIGQITRAVRDLRSSIKLMATIVESAEYVAAASEELTSSAEQSASVSGQVAESVMKVAASCNEQFEAVNQAGSIRNSWLPIWRLHPDIGAVRPADPQGQPFGYGWQQRSNRGCFTDAGH